MVICIKEMSHFVFFSICCILIYEIDHPEVFQVKDVTIFAFIHYNYNEDNFITTLVIQDKLPGYCFIFKTIFIPKAL